MDGNAAFPDISGCIRAPWKEVDRIVCDDALSVPEVNLFVELPEGSAVGCPVCGAECTSINGNEEDIWVDLSRRHGCRLVVRSRVAFAGCPNCGNHKVQFVWEDPESDFTEC